LVAAVIAALVALTLAQRWVGADLWWVELSRYLPYYWLLLVCMAATALSLWLGWRWVVASLAAIGLLCTATMGLCWNAGDVEDEHLRVMTYNIKWERPGKREQETLGRTLEIARHDPDVLMLQDANGLVLDRHAPDPSGGPPMFGMPYVYAVGQYVIASRLPMHDCAEGHIGVLRDKSQRYVRCKVEYKGRTIELVNAHFLSPRGGLRAARRDPIEGADDWQLNFIERLEQSRALAGDLAARPGPKVVAGDLNAVESSPVIRMLLATGLRDAFSSAGRGYGYSYGHVFRGLSFLRIDHVLVSAEIGVARCFVGDGRASDHRAVIADLVVRR
jgi:endonuclease/exonuclease/phosphatase (EEP) superfamily protein YafD